MAGITRRKTMHHPVLIILGVIAIVGIAFIVWYVMKALKGMADM